MKSAKSSIPPVEPGATRFAAAAPARFTGVDAIVLGALLVLAAFLMLRGGSRRGVELMPWPDGLEYAAAAANLADGRGPVMHFGGYSYPSRYTEGYPLLLAGASLLLGGSPARLHWVTLAMGLLAIAALYSLTLALFSRVSAAIAALLLTLSPIFLSYSTLVLSDVPTLTITLLAVLALVRMTEAESAATARSTLAWSALLFGLLCGFTVMIRPTNAAMVAGVVLCVAMVPPAGAGLKIRHMILAALAFAAGFAAFPFLQADQNKLYLGRATANGYAWWVPEVYGTAGKSFSAAYLFGPTMPRNPHGNLPVYLLTLLGLDGLMGDRGDARYFLYPFAGAAFAAIGIAAAIRQPVRRAAKRVVWFGIGLLGALFVEYAAYVFTDIAFLLPGAFILFAAAGFGAVTANAWASRVIRIRERNPRKLAAAAGVILLDALLAISLATEVSVRMNAIPADSAIVPALATVDSALPRNATVVTNISLQFLELYIPGDSRRFVGLNALDPGESFTDYHLRRLYDKRAAGWTGDVPPVVFDGAEMSRAQADVLAATLRAKTPVFLLLAAPESQQYSDLLRGEIDQLQSKFTLKPIAQNAAVALYQLQAPKR
ncbi:MAG TPA: glycosyltransferase family 39 protein [Candidatus Acidoferrales bacterium]|nr:glycosyltransferase family 39 protein [Candidatus Acidoferrales bacterium]